MTFAESLAAHRKERGWTQELLSKKSAVSRYTIARLESGERVSIQVAALIRLADALNVSIDTLVGRSEKADS